MAGPPARRLGPPLAGLVANGPTVQVVEPLALGLVGPENPPLQWLVGPAGAPPAAAAPGGRRGGGGGGSPPPSPTRAPPPPPAPSRARQPVRRRPVLRPSRWRSARTADAPKP